MNTKLIVETGSCHGNSLELCKKYVDLCAEEGIEYLKFQLFSKELTGPNVYLEEKTFQKTLEYANSKQTKINVFASVWGKEKLIFLKELGVTTVKFAHSQRDNIGFAYEIFDKVFVSQDYIDPLPEEQNIIPMFCDPTYPIMHLLDLEAVFKKFHSISDHTVGLHQTMRMLKYHPAFIEKHVAINDSFECLDKRFSITENECRHLARCMRIDLWM